MDVPLVAAYATRLARHRAEAAVLTRRHHQYGNARLALAAAAVGLAALSFGGGRVSPAWLGAPVVLFAVLAAAHSRLLTRQARSFRSAAYLESGIARLEGHWQGRGATGLAYLPEHHPYAEDLDIVGRASLFDLLSRAADRGRGGHAGRVAPRARLAR